MSQKLLGGLVATLAISATLATSGTAGATGTTTRANVKPSGAVSSTGRLTADVARTVKGAGPAAEQKALAKYWSPARMKSAHPDTQLPSVRAAAAKWAHSATTGSLSGSLGTTRGTAGTIGPSAPKATPKQTTAGHAARPAASYPGYPVGHPVARTYGKVFFTSGSLNYVCSGTIVNTEGKSQVWTAGHCVSDGKAWNTNWVFVPNYSDGSAPYGYWSAKQLWTTTAWFNDNNDFANDVGTAVMWRTNGNRITDYLGAQGIAWNQPLGYMYAFGYPQASPFNGKYLVAEQGNTYWGSLPGTIYMINSMTGGSSGGAWLRNFNGQWGYINGHNDFKYTSMPNRMYSPYYGDQVTSLYSAVRGLSS